MTHDDYTFDSVARSERYYSHTLLAHLLMAHQFYGLKLLISHVFPKADFSRAPDDFEIVSELDPLRDGSVVNRQVRKLYHDQGRVAVPDLFVRWWRYCLVIEVKFFTDPKDIGLSKQMGLQKKAISTVRSHTRYGDADYHLEHIVLSVRKRKVNGTIGITWDELSDTILKPILAVSGSDSHYCHKVIRAAVARAKKERQEPASITGSWQAMKYSALIESIPALLQQKKVYIGFTGGEEKLARTTLDELMKRHHYKVSYQQRSKDWLPLDVFLHRVLELKGY